MKTGENLNFNFNEPPQNHPQAKVEAKKRIQILNSCFDAVTTQETVEWAVQLIQKRQRGYICTVNVAILMMMRSNARLGKFIEKAALIVADGQPIIWASRWFSTPLPQRVAGVELIDAIAAEAEQRGLCIYLLGATSEVIAAAVLKLQSKYPQLKISGFDNGYFSEVQAAERVEAIRQSGTQILLVGMGVPRQEFFLEQNWANLGVNLAVGVGGSFEIFAGTKKRAPLWIQQVGLEWLYRLLQEPQRLWKRYLVTNSQFIYELLRALISRTNNKDTICNR